MIKNKSRWRFANHRCYRSYLMWEESYLESYKYILHCGCVTFAMHIGLVVSFMLLWHLSLHISAGGVHVIIKYLCISFQALSFLTVNPPDISTYSERSQSRVPVCLHCCIALHMHSRLLTCSALLIISPKKPRQPKRHKHFKRLQWDLFQLYIWPGLIRFRSIMFWTSWCGDQSCDWTGSGFSKLVISADKLVWIFIQFKWSSGWSKAPSLPAVTEADL